MGSLSQEEKKELIALRNTGEYPIASMSIFDSIDNLKLEDWTIETEIELLEEYKEYLGIIQSMSKEKQKIFLDALKSNEIKANQLMEREDPFFVELGSRKDTIFALDYLLKSENMDPNVLIEAHKIILRGSESEHYCRRNYRKDNATYVTKPGYYEGNTKIHYFALDYHDIPDALDKIVNYYNIEDEEHIFIKPIVTHGLIAGLQLFDDGNTRLARTIQNIQIFKNSKNLLSKIPKQPILYNSASYKMYGGQYRELIGNVIIDESDEVWNRWIRFNLNCLKEQININEERAKKYKGKIYR